jgi:hypothetical protein
MTDSDLIKMKSWRYSSTEGWINPEKMVTSISDGDTVYRSVSKKTGKEEEDW